MVKEGELVVGGDAGEGGQVDEEGLVVGVGVGGCVLCVWVGWSLGRKGVGVGRCGCGGWVLDRPTALSRVRPSMRARAHTHPHMYTHRRVGPAVAAELEGAEVEVVAAEAPRVGGDGDVGAGVALLGVEGSHLCAGRWVGGSAGGRWVRGTRSVFSFFHPPEHAQQPHIHTIYT